MKGKTMETTTETNEVTQEEMARQIERLQNALEESKQGRVDMSNRYSELMERERAKVRKFEAKLEQERAHLKDALAKVYDGQPDFEVDSPEILQILQKAFRIAKLIGYRSEIESLADRVGLNDFCEKMNDETQREHDETQREARIDTIASERMEIHPLDPRAQEVWRRFSREASTLGLCSEYDAIASRLGVPTDFEVAFSGYIDITYSGYSRVHVEGTANRADIVNGDIDLLTESGFRLSEYLDDIEWEIDSTDVDYE